MKPKNKALWQAYEDGRHDERVEMEMKMAKKEILAVDLDTAEVEHIKITPHTKPQYCKTCKWNKDNYCEYFDDEIKGTATCSAYEENGNKKLQDRIEELEKDKGYKVIGGNTTNKMEYYIIDPEKELELKVLKWIREYL